MITIYKKDTSGKIRYISAWTQGAILFQESGVVGTDKPIVHEKVCKAKNVGRSNETTPEDQALSEMNSLIAEKLKGEYFKTLAEAEGESVILPMLAKSYKDEAKKVDWSNAWVQRKYDGMRCLATKSSGKVTLMSREGTEITTVEHIVKQLEDPKIPDGIYDGELYCRELGSFQEQMRAIKKMRPGITEQIEYHIYDLVILDKVFSERFNILKGIFGTSENLTKNAKY